MCIYIYIFIYIAHPISQTKMYCFNKAYPLDNDHNGFMVSGALGHTYFEIYT